MKRILARICLAAGAMGAVALYLDAESMMENSLEARFQPNVRPRPCQGRESARRLHRSDHH